MRFDTTRFGQHTGKTLRRNPTGKGFLNHHQLKTHRSSSNEDDQQQLVMTHNSKVVRTLLVKEKDGGKEPFNKQELLRKVEHLADLQQQRTGKDGYNTQYDYEIIRAIQKLQQTINGIQIVYDNKVANVNKHVGIAETPSEATVKPSKSGQKIKGKKQTARNDIAHWIEDENIEEDEVKVQSKLQIKTRGHIEI